MSDGFLVLVFTSIVDTVPLTPLATKAVGRHFRRAGTADTRPRPTSAPAKPSTATTRTHRTRRIAARFPYQLPSRGRPGSVRRIRLCEEERTQFVARVGRATHGPRTSLTR